MKKSKLRGDWEVFQKDILKILKQNGPLLAQEISDRLDLNIRVVRQLLHAMHMDERIHIKDRVPIARTTRSFLWAAGKGVDALPVYRSRGVAPRAPRRRKDKTIVRQPTEVKVRRDPLMAAFFGPAGTD